jgi:hypothetical protein
METIAINDQLIADAISKTDKDQYGQTRQMDCMPSQLFPDKEVRDLVIKYLESGESKYRLQTYGWRYGTYEAISIYPNK